MDFIKENYFVPKEEPATFKEGIGKNESTENDIIYKIKDSYLRQLIIQSYDLKSKSFFIFGITNPIRLLAIQIVESNLYNLIMLALVLIVGALLSIMWLFSPQITSIEIIFFDLILNIISFILASAFMIEILLKIFAHSAFFSDKSYYHKNTLWNFIDTFIVLAGFLFTLGGLSFFILSAVGALFLTMSSDDNSYSEHFMNIMFTFRGEDNEFLSRFFGIMRLMHFLLPFRGLTIIPVVRILLESMVASLPYLASVLLLTFIIISIFSFLGMSSFMGIFHRRCVNNHNGEVFEKHRICSRDTPDFEPEFVIAGGYNIIESAINNLIYITTYYKRLLFTASGFGLGGRSCPANYSCKESIHYPNPNNKYTGFDNGVQSLFTVFDVMSGDAWFETMFETIDATSFFSFTFFLLLMILGNFLLNNFLIAILSKLVSFRITKFEVGRHKNASMRAIRKAFSLLDTSFTMFGEAYNKVMIYVGSEEYHGFQKFIEENWVKNPVIHRLLYGTSFFSTVLMCFYFYEQPSWIRNMLNTFSYIFLTLTTVDICCSFFALGPKDYFLNDYFNIMDTIGWLVSWIQLFFSLPPTTATIIKLYRLFQVFDLGNQFETIKRLYLVVLDTLWWVLITAILFFLFLAEFALIGHYTFGELKPTQQTFSMIEFRSNRVSFNTFSDAFMTCFHVVTVQDYSDISFEFMKEKGFFSYFYFIVLQVVGKYGIITFILAAMLHSFAKITTAKEAEKSAFEEEATFEDDLKNLLNYVKKLNTREEDMPPEDDEQEESITLLFQDQEIELVNAAEQKKKLKKAKEEKKASNGYDSRSDSEGEEKEPEEEKERENGPIREDEKSDLYKFIEKCFAVWGKFVSICNKCFNVYRKVADYLKLMIVRTAFFEGVIFALIIINCVFLLMETPSLLPTSFTSHTIFWVNFVVTGVFLVEVVIKLFAIGPIMYFLDPWNALDFLVTWGSVISVAVTVAFKSDYIQKNPELMSSLSSLSLLEHVKLLRLLRVLRPLRLMHFLPGLELLVDAFFASIKWITSGVFFVFLIWFVFAVTGVNLFMGRLYACNFYIERKDLDDAILPLVPVDTPIKHIVALTAQETNKNMLIRSVLSPFDSNFKGPYIKTRKSIIRPASPFTKKVFKSGQFLSSPVFGNENSNSNTSIVWHEPAPEYPSRLVIPDKDTCLEMGGKWKTYAFNFDNVINAFLTLFQVASAEGWVDTFYATLDSTGEYLSPVEGNVRIVWVFFLAFFLVGNFFTLSLFSVVLIQNFITLKRAKLEQRIEKRKKGIKRTFWEYIFWDLEEVKEKYLKEREEALAIAKEAARLAGVDATQAMSKQRVSMREKELKTLSPTSNLLGSEKSPLFGASLAPLNPRTPRTPRSPYSPKSPVGTTSGGSFGHQYQSLVKKAKSQLTQKASIEMAWKDMKMKSKWKDLLGFLDFHFSEKKIFLESAVRGMKIFRDTSLTHMFDLLYTSGAFDFFFGLITISNFCLMLFDHYREENDYALIQQTTNCIYTGLFFLEFLVHWHQSGILDDLLDVEGWINGKKRRKKAKREVSRGSYVLLAVDFFVTCISFCENVHFLFTFGMDNLTYYLKKYAETQLGVKDPLFNLLVRSVEVFTNSTSFLHLELFYRIARCLRLFRVTQINSYTAIITQTVVQALPEFFNLLFLYFLICFIYAIAGVGLFGKTQVLSHFQFTVRVPSKTEEPNPYFYLTVPLDVASTVPLLSNAVDRPITTFTLKEYANFHDFFTSFLNVIRISTGGNWDKMLALLMSEDSFCSRKLGNCPPAVIYSVMYFVSLLILMFVIIHLLLGIILNHFSQVFNIYRKLQNASMKMRNEIKMSRFERFRDYLANDVLLMKETQKRFMKEVGKKTKEAEFLHEKVSETMHTLLEQIDDIWLQYCIPTSPKIPFSFHIKLEKLSDFLDRLHREVGFVLKDFENVSVNENLALLFLQKFTEGVRLDMNRGTLTYQDIITAIFNEKFHEINSEVVFA